MRRKVKPNEIAITRVYDATVKQVWEAWTDSKKVEKWWGPRGFSLTTHSKDLRPGGYWIYTMHGPDGVDYPNKTTYFEVEKYKRLVYDHGASDDRPPLFRVTVDFAETNGKTVMEMTMSLASAEAAKEIREFIKKAGGNSTWDRLAEHLAETVDSKDIFVINRSFNASVNTVFEMWTKPAQFAKWIAPVETSLEMLRAPEAVNAGSSIFYRMYGGGLEFFGRAEYLEARRAEKLTYIQNFCDQNENLRKHPMVPLWPDRMMTTVLFSEEEPEQTRVTVIWTVHGPATEQEVIAFKAERGGMTLGWTGSFDKLDDLLLVERS